MSFDLCLTLNFFHLCMLRKIISYYKRKFRKFSDRPYMYIHVICEEIQDFVFYFD